MNLEDLFEARLAGEQPDVPEALGEELKHALAAHEALQFALGETILLPASEADDCTPPSLPADYEIVRELGRGGMGVVYLTRQKSLDRLVAVKVLRPGELAFGPMVRRFLDEAKHLARLRHPNLVSVHEVGEAGGEPYFSMDYIEGESLADLLRRERLSPSRALAILKQAAEGVAHAHQTGIIHRDLKPANILIDPPGRAYVTDFGLARNLTDESDRTHSGAVMGTPQYMSPEQARGETRLVGETTDVHALGAVLYEMLTGRPPYGSDNPMQILLRLVHEEPAPPRRIDPRIGRDLETISLKALAKQPAARYATVRAMLEDIHRYETGQPLMARRPGLGHHAKRLARRYGKLVAAALVAAAVAAVAVLAVAPKPVDKSVDELIEWGESEQSGGRPAVAVKIYHRALLKASPVQRAELLNRIVRCVSEIDDPRRAIDAAVEVIDDVPDSSFGKYDLPVAQDVLARLRTRYPDLLEANQDDNGRERPTAPEEARPLMQLLEKRLLLALSGGTRPHLPAALQGPAGTPNEWRECVELLYRLKEQLVPRVVSKAPALSQFQQDAEAVSAARLSRTLPTELLDVAADEARSAPVRILAAFKAGEELEKSGDEPAALDAYARAYSLRSKFPFYAVTVERQGAASSAKLPTAGPSREGDLRDAFLGSPADAVEVCLALRDAYAACRRLDPEDDHVAIDDLRGGLRLHFHREELPREFNLHIRLEIAAESDPATITSMLVPVRTAATWVGVADGHYRLKCNGIAASKDLFETMMVDSSALPAEVEVHGETIDLPPIRLGILADIKSLSPADGPNVELATAVFRWAPLAGAATYQIHFQLSLGDAHSTTWSWPVSLSGTSASFCLGADQWKALFTSSQAHTGGRTGVWLWTVSAYDANNVQIGKTYGPGRRFRVAGPP